MGSALKASGGQEVIEFPGNFYFPESKLLLSTYVDDLTLAGPADQHQKFWEKLTSLVDVEPPEPIYRVLGRNGIYCGYNLLEHPSTKNWNHKAQRGLTLYYSYRVISVKINCRFRISYTCNPDAPIFLPILNSSVCCYNVYVDIPVPFGAYG